MTVRFCFQGVKTNGVRCQPLCECYCSLFGIQRYQGVGLTYVFAEEANPHGAACAAHVHGEDRLLEGIGHAGQVHVLVPAHFHSLEPRHVLLHQFKGVVLGLEGLRSHLRLF